MTKKQLLESKAFQEISDDTELWIYSGCFFRKLEFVEKKSLWIEDKKKEVLTFSPSSKGYFGK